MLPPAASVSTRVAVVAVVVMESALRPGAPAVVFAKPRAARVSAARPLDRRLRLRRGRRALPDRES